MQVWFNLAWFGYGPVHRYPRLGALRTKNRHFTEEDKQEALAIQRQVVRDIIPLYRTLLEREQIELTTTPFFHPIMPLVIDTEITRRARPELPLPSRFRAPDDADAQLRRAVEYHTATFGQAPVGLWPSEGSVCPEVIPLAAANGFRWLVTDEGILARSRALAQQSFERHRDLYRPYRVGQDGQAATIVFRDREISDAFGFVYYKNQPDSAAEDVLRRLRDIIDHAPQDQVLVAIVLDGENPWEHYHEGGERFLSLLYTAFAEKRLDHDGLRVFASTMSEGLMAVPTPEPLSHLHSGSWINQDYKIWIGHHEDNQGWDLLGHTRARLLDAAPSLPTDKAQAAWNELYAAEGSDWFWWYGDDFDTDYKQEFDRLFRTHVRNVWTLMGLTPPDLLNQPICQITTQPDADRVTIPYSLIAPTIDGIVTDFFEWRGAGSINTQPPLGAMWKADGFFTSIHFGWGLDHLYLRLDPDEASQARQGAMTLEVILRTPQRTFRLTCAMDPVGADRFILSHETGADAWQEVGAYQSIARNTVLELAVPLKDLQLEQGQELRVHLVLLEQGLEVGRYPYHQPATLTVPGPEFDAATWRV